MNSPSFQSYTPRVRRLGYDALSLNLGCQVISGLEFRGFAPLVQICVSEHDSASSQFSKMATVSYTRGPASTGIVAPHKTRWAAWVANNGLRAAKNVTTITPPAIGTGEQSTLFNTGKPTAVSLAFSNIGEMAIAAQTSVDTITLKRFTSTVGDIASVSITGRSPLLWYTGQLYGGEELDFYELVLLYLMPERPNVLFGRFQSENFGTAHELASSLPVNLLSLNEAEATGDRKLRIYARSDIGRDISIYSDPYAAHGDDQTTLQPAFTSGFYFESAEPVDADQDDAILQLAFESGIYFLSTKSAGTLDEDTASLSIAFVSGDYS